MITAVFILMLATACSGSNTSVLPDQTGIAKTTAGDSSHQLWGLYQFTFDPDAGNIEVAPLRGCDMHLNAIVFLEPPPLSLLTLEHIEFNGNLVTADIGLRHPFLGLNEFTGFDVCGVFISKGSLNGFTDTDIVMAGEGDTRLLNPDGLTRWWNPSEFPYDGTMFGYKDGLLGTKDSVADFNCTINGYKYFADGLGPTDDYLTVDPSKRGVFSAGAKNIRRYELELGDTGLVFNYAIDANWQFPDGQKPWAVPGDFPPTANRPEAWGVDITETSNSLYNNGSGDSGGELGLSIDVYDHYNPDLNTVRVESPGNFDMVESSTPVGGGNGYSTYEIEISDATPTPGSINLLITVESEVEDYGGILPGKKQAVYFTHASTVEESSPANPVEGNVLLETIRDGYKAITGLRLSWTGNGSPEYAVYADTEPYGGFDDFSSFVGATTGANLVFNSTGWDDFSTNAAYAFTVRARSIAGSPASESGDSEYCFCDLDDFEGGTGAGGGTWISRAHNPDIQFEDSNDPWTVHGSGNGCFAVEDLRLSYTEYPPDPSHPYTNWICLISSELPDVDANEEARFEFNIHYKRETISGYGNYADQRVVGCCVAPPANAAYPIDFDVSGPHTRCLEGFNYDWSSSCPTHYTIYEIFGAPYSYNSTLGPYFWYSPLTEYTHYTAWSFYESFENLEGYLDGRRYVGIGYGRSLSSLNDDSWHYIAYDDFAVIIY